MKQTFDQEFRPCSCGNHHLFEAGDACDTCGGIVPNPTFVETWPEMKDHGPYDAEYFEQLELHYDSMEIAA